MQLKTALRFKLPQSGWQKSIEQMTTNSGGDKGKREPSFTVGGIANWYGHHGNKRGKFPVN